MTHDAQLRAERMIFYEKDIQRLDAELDAFLELSHARSAMLIDIDGHPVTRRGEPSSGSDDSIAALIAGSFAATRELARLLGEENFTQMFHQGQRDSIQLTMVSSRTILAVLFDQRTNLGLVRFYAQESVRRLHEQLMQEPEPGERPEIGDAFRASAEEALDRLF